MQTHRWFKRQHGLYGRLGHTLVRSFVVAGLTVSLLTLPAGGPFATTFQTSVAEAAPVEAQKQCPPTLSEGSRGDYVVYLQHLLNRYLYIWGLDPIPADGVYGGQTKGYVKALQAHEDLDIDGIAGPKTWRALKAC